MTSRERVTAAAKGQPVDRVPVFYWIEAHTGARLVAEYRSSGNWRADLMGNVFWALFKGGGYIKAGHFPRFFPMLFDVHSYNYANEYAILLGADMVLASYATPTDWMPLKLWKQDGRWVGKDRYGVIRSIGNGLYPDMVDPPIKTVEDLNSYQIPDVKSDKLYDTFRSLRKKYPDLSIATEVWSVQDFPSTQLMGTDRFMTFIMDHPEEMKRFQQRWADAQIEVARRSVAAGADIVFIFDDYGYNNRPQMSMKMWREYTFPQLKRIVDAGHELGCPVILHSCGYQVCFLDDYVKLGIDMLQSFQPHAGNDFREAFAKYGDKLTFVTGIDIQRGEKMTPEELKAEIIENYKIGRATGRHMLGTTHELQYTMPLQNLKTIFQTVNEIQAGKYDSR
jgi:uroporphyrinogen decarboxylase